VSDYLSNIWRLQAQYDTRGLIEALSNADPGIRKRAAAALRTLGAVEAVPTLKQALTVEKDPEARSAITAALEHLLPEEADKVPKLVAQLKSADPEVVIRTVRALGELKDKTAVEPLVLVFHNPQLSGAVRLAAAEALIQLESAPAVVTLLAALHGKDWHIRRNAVAVLGQLRADWAVEPIAERLSDENDIVRRTARAALKRISTPDALRALEAMTDKTQPVNPKAKTARLAATEPFTPGNLQDILKARADAKVALPEAKSDDAEGETQPMTPTTPTTDEKPDDAATRL
jgi:HEAT repeat protein